MAAGEGSWAQGAGRELQWLAGLRKLFGALSLKRGVKDWGAAARSTWVSWPPD